VKLYAGFVLTFAFYTALSHLLLAVMAVVYAGIITSQYEGVTDQIRRGLIVVIFIIAVFVWFLVWVTRFVFSLYDEWLYQRNMRAEIKAMLLRNSADQHAMEEELQTT